MIKKITSDTICGAALEYSVLEDDSQIPQLAIKLAHCLEKDTTFNNAPCTEDFRVVRTRKQFRQALLRLKGWLVKNSHN
jgi:hypothetical protein